MKKVKKQIGQPVKWNTNIFLSLIGILTVNLGLVSCENFLDVPAPSSKIKAKIVFKDDASATAAIVGIYLDMSQGSANFASGKEASIVLLAGLSSDELHSDPSSAFHIRSFELNHLTADNINVSNLWASLYKTIYQANAALEGLSGSSGITESTYKQLRGEALIIRAFCHFYLVNLFGDVPLVMTTDYRQTSAVTRTASDKVYDQIELDLLEAENLMPVTYPTEGRVRPNKLTATALLARLYLYKKDWQRSEDKSTNVINQATLYNLTPNLNAVFLANSSEAIWQLKPPNDRKYVNEGDFFLASSPPYVLDSAILIAFEPGDKRKNSWIRSDISGNYPFKYKNTFSSVSETTEYQMIIRLSELLLIRAEARANQDKLSQAIADLDMVRDRADITLLAISNPDIEQEDLLIAIENERRIELMFEWGHRWFDLKRLDHANDVLNISKPDWTTEDQLYPIPEKDLIRNSNLRPQNPGY